MGLETELVVILVCAERQRKSIPKSNAPFIFPPQVRPSVCSMIPLLSLLAALVLTQAPAVLADDLKEDSSGEQPSRGPMSLLHLPYGRKLPPFNPSHLLSARVPERRQMRKFCGQGLEPTAE